MIPPYANRMISMLYRYGQRYISGRLKLLEVDVGQLPFLLRAYDEPGVTQERMSCVLGMDKGTTARGVAHLEELGLIERTVDTRDRRVNHIYPTPQGEALRGELLEVVADLQRIFFDGLSREEAEEFNRLALRMAENIKREVGGRG